MRRTEIEKITTKQNKYWGPDSSQCWLVRNDWLLCHRSRQDLNLQKRSCNEEKCIWYRLTVKLEGRSCLRSIVLTFSVFPGPFLLLSLSILPCVGLKDLIARKKNKRKQDGLAYKGAWLWKPGNVSLVARTYNRRKLTLQSSLTYPQTTGMHEHTHAHTSTH